MKPRASDPAVLRRLHRSSPIGPIECLFDGNALVALEFDALSARTQALLARHLGDFRLETGADRAGIADLIDRYFAGELRAPDAIPVARYGTPFQRRVWSALRRIPPGTTMSYAALARKLGVPNAQRAVGAANGANPLSIVVPCHRLVGSDGSLVKYGGGIDRKRWLLRHEAAFA